MKRRDFLSTTLSTSAISLFPSQLVAQDKLVSPYLKNIGIQLYTLRNQIKKDVAGTLKAVADSGYKQVELYGFPNADNMVKAAKDNGLAIHSSHFAWESVTDPEKKGVKPFAEILEKANAHGLTHLVIPYIHGHNRKDLDAYKRLAERCNEGAAEAKKAGITLAYHNHAFEFAPMNDEGTSGFDVFIEEFGDDMAFELDVFWVKVGGVDPVALINALKGRVSQLHLKDLKLGHKVPMYNGIKPDAFQELGDGMIPMKPILDAATDVGVAHCHVEQDHSPNPVGSIRQSLNYLNTL